MAVFAPPCNVEAAIQALVAEVQQWHSDPKTPFIHLSDNLWNILCSLHISGVSDTAKILVVDALEVRDQATAPHTI